MPTLNRDAWERIGASHTVLDWIEHGVPLEFKQEPSACEFKNVVKTQREFEFITGEINKLLLKGAVKKVSPQEVKCVLPLKCVPKKQNKLRLVLDCRHVNENIVCPKFSQEGIQSVADQILEDDDLISIDLKDGFHHIKVRKKDQKYLSFKWGDQYYTWCVLAFGIKSAPYFFNKVLRPVVSFLREHGIRNTVFVDDFLVMMRSLVCTDHKEFVINTLQELGWIINVEKSHLIPSKSCEFIGYNVHTQGKKGPWLQVTYKKLHKLRRHIRFAVSQTYIKARFLAKIGGECIAMMKAILPAKLLLRNLYRTLATKSSWDSVIFLDEECRRDLNWWLVSLTSWNGAPLHTSTPTVQIATDASGTGWGGAWGTREASGTWTKDVSFQPSNYRELLAIYKTLQSFQNDLKGNTVQILSDNVTAVAYVNKLGGTNKIMCTLMNSIFTLTQENNITLSAKFLAGKMNGHADFLSRILSPYEWQLHPAVFRMLDRMWGPHTVDRFASETTTQLRRYNSLFDDPATEAVDSMSQSWSRDNNYINPPFWLLNKIVKKIQNEAATATIIAPKWDAQPWCQKLRELSISPPLRLKNSPEIMLKRSGVPEPLKNKHWKLYAWRICGSKN